jgi:hypothetical protein
MHGSSWGLEVVSPYFKEKERDVKTLNSRPILKTCYKMEAEAAKVYTIVFFDLSRRTI